MYPRIFSATDVRTSKAQLFYLLIFTIRRNLTDKVCQVPTSYFIVGKLTIDIYCGDSFVEFFLITGNDPQDA